MHSRRMSSAAAVSRPLGQLGPCDGHAERSRRELLEQRLDGLLGRRLAAERAVEVPVQHAVEDVDAAHDLHLLVVVDRRVDPQAMVDPRRAALLDRVERDRVDVRELRAVLGAAREAEVAAGVAARGVLVHRVVASPASSPVPLAERATGSELMEGSNTCASTGVF